MKRPMDFIMNASSSILEESSFTNIYSMTETFTSSGVGIFISIILVVMVILKIVKFGLKWKKNKLDATEAITQTNALLTGLVDMLDKQTLPPQCMTQ